MQLSLPLRRIATRVQAGGACREVEGWLNGSGGFSHVSISQEDGYSPRNLRKLIHSTGSTSTSSSSSASSTDEYRDDDNDDADVGSKV